MDRVTIDDLEIMFLEKALEHKDKADKGSEYSLGAGQAYMDAADAMRDLLERL